MSLGAGRSGRGQTPQYQTSTKTSFARRARPGGGRRMSDHALAPADPWNPLADACSGMALAELIAETLRQKRDRQEDSRKEFREDWKQRNGKDHERWRPLPGDSIEVRFTGAHYGVDAAGKKWRLPEARDILNRSRDDKDAWFRVARVEDLLAKEQKKHLNKKRL